MTEESVEAPGRSRGRPKVLSDAERRDRLVEVATGLFADLGFGRTTMDLVAARAHVSKQTLYRLFPNKSTLFVAAIERHRQSMLKLPGDYDEVPLAEALARIFRADLDRASFRDHMRLIETALAESVQYPEVAETLHRYGAAPSRAELAGWLAHEMARGRLAHHDDPPALADILMHMIFSTVRFHCEGPCAADTAVDRETLVRRCIDVFLHGTVPR